MTIAEIALLLKETYYPTLELHCVAMDGWWRNSLWNETGLPWVMPSPNMPTPDTAIVYPGMVLLEGTNLSEGRGTTRPFELFGAPYLDIASLKQGLSRRDLPGCAFRSHGFIPTFQKWQGAFCHGMQIHVTQPRQYRPVRTAVALLSAVISSCGDSFRFTDPPYEYESEKMPFDILAGSNTLRKSLLGGTPPEQLEEQWHEERTGFDRMMSEIALYPEECS
jgi:uncharacterized protein YbbC (DUF1343 family)